MRANGQIRFSPLIIIDEDGTNLGEMTKEEALRRAEDKGLDLVEINPTNRPPICKIMDFGKYKYDLAKKLKESRAHQKEVGLKEIRLSAKIGEHDIDYKAKQARDFFDDGNRVKVSMRLRGRENVFVDQAMSVFSRFAEKANLDYETPPKKLGNTINAMLTAKKEPKENNFNKDETKNTESNN